MKNLWILAVAAASVCACASPSRFEWGSYESSLYVYSKAPEQREEYRKSLISAINEGERTNRVAPGMYAELGYLYVEDNNLADARVSFGKEMALFPESRAFLSSVMSRLDGTSASSPASASAPSS